MFEDDSTDFSDDDLVDNCSDLFHDSDNEELDSICEEPDEQDVSFTNENNTLDNENEMEFESTMQVGDSQRSQDEEESHLMEMESATSDVCFDYIIVGDNIDKHIMPRYMYI